MAATKKRRTAQRRPDLVGTTLPEVDIAKVRHLGRVAARVAQQIEADLEQYTSGNWIDRSILGRRAHERLLCAERCHDSMAAESESPNGHYNAYRFYGEVALGDPKKGGELGAKPSPTRDQPPWQPLVRPLCDLLEHVVQNPDTPGGREVVAAQLWELRVRSTGTADDFPFMVDAAGLRPTFGPGASKKTQAWARDVCRILQKPTRRQTPSGVAVQLAARTAEVEARSIRRIRGPRPMRGRELERVLALLLSR